MKSLKTEIRVAIPEELPSRGTSSTSNIWNAKTGQDNFCTGPKATVCKDNKEATIMATELKI